MRSLTCRICGSNETNILPVGEYAPFFRLRVETSKDEFLLFSRADSIQIRPMPFLIRALLKIGNILSPPKNKPAKQFRTHMLACTICHTITPCHEYSFDDLLGLYQDYRSDTYNQDRISVEPTYSRIVKDVGAHQLEITNRNAAVDEFLRKNSNYFISGAMIDYGGSDGRFIPPFINEQFDNIDIYDASEAPLHSSVDARKVRKITDPKLGIYSFLTCMHVLEHVGNPRALVIEAARLLVPGGLLYLEVPHELNQSLRED